MTENSTSLTVPVCDPCTTTTDLLSTTTNQSLTASSHTTVKLPTKQEQVPTGSLQIAYLHPQTLNSSPNEHSLSPLHIINNSLYSPIQQTSLPELWSPNIIMPSMTLPHHAMIDHDTNQIPSTLVSETTAVSDIPGIPAGIPTTTLPCHLQPIIQDDHFFAHLQCNNVSYWPLLKPPKLQMQSLDSPASISRAVAAFSSTTLDHTTEL